MTVIDITTPRWWLGSSEDKSLRSCEHSAACNHRTFARLQSFVNDILVTEPASFVTVEFIDCLNGRTHITENIEKISDCFACVS